METKSIFLSKTFWGAMLAVFGPLLVRYFHLSITGQNSDDITSAIVAIVGASLTIYGRIKASKQVTLTGSTSKALLFVLLPSVLLLTGCPKAVEHARDVIAAGNGAITYAQGEYHDECTADPSLKDCVTINRAIGLENTAIDALTVYCSGIPKDGNPPFASGGPCAPDKSYLPKLQQALSDLKVITNDLKLLQKGKSK